MIYRTIAFSGTSLTSGVASRGWQTDVINRLQVGCQYELRNFDMGNPGRTSAQGLADIGRLDALKPDLAVIEYAMNDALTSLSISVATLRSNLSAIVDAVRVKNPSATVFLMTMNPAISPGSANVPNLPDYYQGVRDEAVAKGTLLIDNTPLWGTPSSADIPDGIHPVRSAVLSVLVPNVVSSLSPYL